MFKGEELSTEHRTIEGVSQEILHTKAISLDKKELPPLVPINGVQQQGQMHKAVGFNPDFQAAGFARFPPSCPLQFQYRMEASSQNYTGCTYNFFSQENAMPQPQPQKKRRAYIIESDDEDLTLKKTIFAVTRF